MTASLWDQRIARAEELADSHRAARDILRFYAKIAGLQKIVHAALTSAASPRPDASVLLPHFPALFNLVRRDGPPPLAQSAAQLATRPDQWQPLLADQDAPEAQAFFARALLQPYFEFQASQNTIATNTVQPACPFCGERPVVAVLRGEGEGGKRSLVCSLCATEWEFRRLLCPNCGEEKERSLPVYVASEFPHVRVEACDTCRTYIKSVDLTRNGLAVPVVDELATVALNLWAADHDYVKFQPNLLGM
ncbi:MAG TPA: formate dehydrogenase accessory protein FdhE [Bryobacteraceae bacterium]|nr:formate dehydrogenase accessory protein FdhE [Bryobacteraceae bacterium]